jgi:transposase
MDTLLGQAAIQGMCAVIRPKKNRKHQRAYDKNLYTLRQLIKNAFLHLKRWRGIATRYAKNSTSFLAAIHIRCLALWLKIS